MSGTIHAVGAQAYAAVSSLMCLCCISLPVSYMLGVQQESLAGLWCGYGASALTLGMIYLWYFVKLDWKETALQASKDEI